MSKLPSFCLALAVAATLTPLSAQETATAPAPAAEAAPKRTPPGNLVVAVVDLDKAMEQYPRFIRGSAQLRQMNTAYDEQLQQARKRIEELKAGVALLRDGTKERALKQLDLENAMRNANDLAKLFNADLNIEGMRLQVQCYEDLETAVAQLAKERGVHLVVRLDGEAKAANAESLLPNQIERRMLSFERRKVWFAAEELDLTVPLIKMMQTFDPKESGKDAEAPAAPGSAKDQK